MAALVLNPIVMLILAWPMQPAAATHAVAVGHGEAQLLPRVEPNRVEPNRLDPPLATSTAAPTPTAPASAKPNPASRPRLRRALSAAPTTPTCTGPPLTSQSQVQPNTSYCGGHATSRIVLANGDTWTNGEVSGAVTGSQQGAVECGNPCHLYNMYIHDNPASFAGIYSGGPAYESGPMVVQGGRVTGSGSLGIGGGVTNGLTISGVEIDHNGASASCGFEGGGFKGVNQGSRFTGNYVHDNNCMGVWYDVSADNNEIDHNRVDNNADGGIFYEISFNGSIHDNEVSGNGKSACGWLWGSGIGIADSFNVNVYNNTLSGNCNGVGEVQQTRTDSTPPAHLLENVAVTGNVISASGKTGAVTDNGTNLSTRNLSFSGNSYGAGAVFCGLTC